MIVRFGRNNSRPSSTQSAQLQYGSLSPEQVYAQGLDPNAHRLEHHLYKDGKQYPL
jgi:hypothetical protein